MPTAGETAGIVLGAIALTVLGVGAVMHHKRRRRIHPLYTRFPRHPFYGWHHPDIHVHLPEEEP